MHKINKDVITNNVPRNFKSLAIDNNQDDIMDLLESSVHKLKKLSNSYNVAAESWSSMKNINQYGSHQINSMLGNFENSDF